MSTFKRSLLFALDLERIICDRVLSGRAECIAVAFFNADEIGADDAVLIAVQKDQRPFGAAFRLEIGVVFQQFEFFRHIVQ